jgi:hypothetical protein
MFARAAGVNTMAFHPGADAENRANDRRSRRYHPGRVVREWRRA